MACVLSSQCWQYGVINHVIFYSQYTGYGGGGVGGLGADYSSSWGGGLDMESK